MLVDCPECHKKISSDAKFCPNCGLPNAGNKSRQIAEKIASDRMRYEKAGYSNCPKCNNSNRNISCKVEYSEGGIGFYIVAQYECGNCGKSYTLNHTEHW